MALATYDPKKIVITLGGTPIVGLADGTFVSFERINDAYSITTGADGLTTRTKTNDKSGTLTLTLQQSSLSNNFLSTIYNLDETANAGVVALGIKDILGLSIVTAGFAWIKKLPVVEYGNELSNREWMIDCADTKVFVGGNI
tara:strand:- start:608 stop:1033 length:426 start_codon:yes stop_codon:yes gene_type:complete